MKSGLREERITALGGVKLVEECDIVTARQRARQLSELVGLQTGNQARVATAISELARNAFQYGHGGRIDFGIDLSAAPQVLWADVVDRGPGIANLQAILDGQYESATGMGIGLTGTRRLMDYFEARSQPGSGTHVRIGKTIPYPARRLTAQDAAAIREGFLKLEPVTTHEELARQVRELAYALEALKAREADLEARSQELHRLNVELDETNRGVVALYAELDEKAAALRQADEMKSRILWHVSHEFRTPVGSILALSHLLRRGTDGPLTDEQDKQIGFIAQAASELAAMVNDLLDLARVDAGRSEVKKSPVKVGPFLGSVRGLMRPLLTHENVALIFEEVDEGLVVETDETKLGQIVRNLISNALKFTERGEVRVSCRPSPDNDAVEFTVADTGIGIAPENLDRVFEEFAQVEHPIQRQVKGTGLGLPLSRKLAKLLGGELEVRSELGVGSTFVLSLPLGERAKKHGQPVVLVIDDEEASRYLADQLFRESKVRVVQASDGGVGAELARFERPALILLDLIMPGRSGFEILDELKANPDTASIPVVIYTSMNLTASDFERLGGHCAAILPKLGSHRTPAFQAMRRILKDPELFKDEPEFAEVANA